MKKILIFLFAFNTTLCMAKDLFCGVYLIDINSDKVLNHKVIVKEGVGILSGNNIGNGFYIEKKKRRFLSRPLILSQISFNQILINEGEYGEAIFTFYRQSNPTKYGRFLDVELLGEKVQVGIHQSKVDVIDEQYMVKSYCSFKEEV